MTTADSLKTFLDEKSAYYNQPSFIESDPVSIPHLFSKKQDIEISGFFAAVFAWGQRKTIINKSRELLAMMDNAPHDFIMNHSEKELRPIEHFKHRTFNATDALYFIHFLKYYYSENDSMEDLFLVHDTIDPVEHGLIKFHESFFSLPDAPPRTRKHIPSPNRKSTCKRLNMYLRWMVRKDQSGVDFGIWKKIKMKDLICPIDVHVDRIARRLSLIRRKQTDWLTAVQLTENLKKLDPEDPVKYDYALFGLGVIEKALHP
ncbi:MAG: TIGR02757 family protein [Cyclobacteriaceae bacterium]|jgi:uncharacterized protein (TIGR02757 family)